VLAVLTPRREDAGRSDALGVAGGREYLDCYRGILGRLAADAPRRAQRDAPDEEQSLPRDFAETMLAPIARLVQEMWLVTPSTLLAWSCPAEGPRRAPRVNPPPFADEETLPVAFVERLARASAAERGEDYRPNPRILRERKYASPAASYHLHLKEVMSDFVTSELIGEGRIRIFQSFIACLGCLFLEVFKQSGAEVKLVLKGGVCVRLWLFMLFARLPGEARAYARRYTEERGCALFGDLDFEILPVSNCTRETLRKIERLAFMALIRLTHHWSGQRRFYFDFFRLPRAAKDAKMKRVLEEVRRVARTGGAENFYTDVSFEHILWEDEGGRVESYPPLGGGASTESVAYASYAGYRGVSRNSFVRMCNVAEPEREEWELFDAQHFFGQEMDGLSHEDRCSYWNFQAGHHGASFLYASFNATCTPTPSQTFSLGRIMANFVFLCEKTVRRKWSELSGEERRRAAAAKPSPAALAYILHPREAPRSYKVALRIPGEIVDLANGSAFGDRGGGTTPTVAVSLRGVEVHMVAVPALAEEQIRMVLRETDFAPWSAERKSDKRTCRMFLLALWSAVSGVASWDEYERRMLPFLLLRGALKSLAEGRRLDFHAPSPALMAEQPATSISLVRALSECFLAFQTGRRTTPMLRWAETALDVLDFGMVITFLLTGNVVRPWQSEPRWGELGAVGRVLSESHFGRARGGPGPLGQRSSRLDASSDLEEALAPGARGAASSASEKTSAENSRSDSAWGREDFGAPGARGAPSSPREESSAETSGLENFEAPGARGPAWLPPRPTRAPPQ
jgi:hypothetical protein